jgi:ABC-2 type transport system ATP-binding protein
MAEVERLADRVILLDAGRILEDEAPRVLIETYGRATLEDVFLDVVRGRSRHAEQGELAPAEVRAGETL